MLTPGIARDKSAGKNAAIFKGGSAVEYWGTLVIIATIWLSAHYLRREIERRFALIEQRLDVLYDRITGEESL